MSRLSETQRKLMSYIDAIMTLLGYNETFSIESLIMDFINPLDYLIEIISKYIPKEQLIEKLAYMVTATLPAIELGVKGVILSNFKTQIDCNNDPRIPWKFRRAPEFESWYEEEGNRHLRGIPINLHNIDYKNILSVSPLSEYGQNYYFGTRSAYQIECADEDLNGKEFRTYAQARQFVIDNGLKIDNIINVSEIDNVHELCRAEDFNAFLWYVYHKTYYGSPLDASNVKNYQMFKPFTTTGDGSVQYSVGTTIQSGSCIHICYKVKISHDGYSNPTQEGVYSDYILASEALMKNEGVKWEAYFVPITSAEANTIHGANWYVNKKAFYDFLLPQEKRQPRDHNVEIPICNVEYIGTEQRFDSNLGIQEDTVLVSILPKPNLHTPQINVSAGADADSGEFKINVSGEPPWRVKRLLYDADGNPDPKGKYSVKGYQALNEDGSYEPLKGDDKANMYECYPGQTIYEFNYDFLMSIKLFDPVVITKQIIETVTNIGPMPPIGSFVNKSETEYQMRVSQIVENVINATASETTSCFYNFSNKQFEELSRKAELKRSQGYSFTSDTEHVYSVSTNHVLDILNEFRNDATLEENTEVITRALKDVTATVTDEVLPEDQYSLELDLIKNMLKALTNCIVETLLSPKVVLLFEINKKLMEPNESKPLSIEAFIESISGLLIGIVSEVADLILRELLNWAISILQDLLEKITIILINEQTSYYTALMIELIKACGFLFKPNLRANLDSSLDQVYYADIDPIEKPITETC